MNGKIYTCECGATHDNPKAIVDEDFCIICLGEDGGEESDETDNDVDDHTDGEMTDEAKLDSVLKLNES